MPSDVRTSRGKRKVGDLYVQVPPGVHVHVFCDPAAHSIKVMRVNGHVVWAGPDIAQGPAGQCNEPNDVARSIKDGDPDDEHDSAAQLALPCAAQLAVPCAAPNDLEDLLQQVVAATADSQSWTATCIHILLRSMKDRMTGLGGLGDAVSTGISEYVQTTVQGDLLEAATVRHAAQALEALTQGKEHPMEQEVMARIIVDEIASTACMLFFQLAPEEKTTLRPLCRRLQDACGSNSGASGPEYAVRLAARNLCEEAHDLVRGPALMCRRPFERTMYACEGCTFKDPSQYRHTTCLDL
jgi:hypothetical protein